MNYMDIYFKELAAAVKEAVKEEVKKSQEQYDWGYKVDTRIDAYVWRTK